MNRNPIRPFALLVLFAVLLAIPTPARSAPPAAPQLEFFENNIRPLIVNRCLKCHGPKKAEAGLRLDSQASMLKGGDSGPAAIVGMPQKSLILKAVRHEDGLEMPPDTRLSNREIDALAKWVKDGVVWPAGMTLGASGPKLRGGPITNSERKFWSFQPLADPKVPRQQSDRWSRNDIDRFVLRQLQTSGLKHNPPVSNRGARDGKRTPPVSNRGARDGKRTQPASKRVLIRRATFDLTGLPPTPDEIDLFIADESPNAFQRVVDRLLNSRAYGERWGRHWLDVVRYADTAGETADYPTPLSYKYRNWVIDAFNNDKPYDQFLREQIAGDILAKQSKNISEKEFRDMMVATGFIAISRRFGFDVENYHNLTIQDTIDTLGQAVLGLSLGCARCHDHKYDPINTADYYSWYGIFESTRYSFPGSEQKKRPYDSFPALPKEQADRLQAQHTAAVKTLTAQTQTLEAEQKKLDARLKFVASNKTAVPKEKPVKTTNPWLLFIADGLLDKVEKGKHPGILSWKREPLPLVAVNAGEKTQLVPGTVPPKTLVVHPNPKNGIAIGWHSPFAGEVSISGYVKDAHNCGDSVAWYVDRLGKDTLTAIAQGACNTNGSQRFDQAKDAAALKQVKVKKGDFIQLVILPKANHGCDLTQVDFQIKDIKGNRTWKLVEDVRETFLVGNPHADRLGNAATWYFYEIPPDRGQSFSNESLLDLATIDVEATQSRLVQVKSELAKLKPQLETLMKKPAVEFIYGAVDQDKPADAKIQIRGDQFKLGEVTKRKNLEILGNDALPTNAGSGRLEMAQWLTRDANALTARVIVNRIWQQHFGRGIVGTENDFGARGEQPTHPELLDWLAIRFKENKWSIKSLHRLIMNSATYQQSSDLDELAFQKDPDARLLWRFNRRRLSAEEIRDSMLFVSGGLDNSVGEAHPFPPIDKWGFSQHAPYYGVYPSNRRSVYLMQQRLKRHPFLGLFDGADTNVSTARRELTTVPTQALFLMNNQFVHERAASFGKQIIASSNDRKQRIELAFKQAIGRSCSADELKQTQSFLDTYQAALPTKISQAEKEATGWSAFLRTLLTRNEFLFVD
jgi:hypothetical protein